MDISGLRNTSGIGLIFAAQTPDEFSLDLDDVEIFVVPGGGDPNPVDFTALTVTVTDAKVKIHTKRKKDKHPKDKDEFEIKKGQLTLGDDFDGFDLDTEDLTITFGDLEWTIPAGSFVRDDDDDDGKWKFRSKRPDDLHIDIRDDGRFKVKVKRLDLSEVVDLKDKDQLVTFALTIGDDTGDFPIDFDKKGQFKVKKHKKDKKHDDDDDD